jgi:catechol 2,3-dioxygenase-like lactoylglutathione lyase family enzyme
LATIRYLVDDVDACLPFYEKLGFALMDRWGPPFAILRRDDLELWVSGPGTSASRALADGRQPGPGGWNRMVIEVDDLPQALRDLSAIGARARGEPVSGPGGSQVLVDDPSGNAVELFQSK